MATRSTGYEQVKGESGVLLKCKNSDTRARPPGFHGEMGGAFFKNLDDDAVAAAKELPNKKG